MKSIGLICFALLVTTTAGAGVRIESVMKDLKTQALKPDPTILLVQDGKVRYSQGTDTGIILKGDVMYIIDEKRKAYREMDKATMKAMMERAAAAMKQMQADMAKMPPAQREQMEKMMGTKMPGMGAKAPEFTARDTGKTESAEGRSCRVWHLLRDGAIAEELCVVPFASFPGKEDVERSFKALSEAFAGLASAVPGAGDPSKARNSINGYPVRTRIYHEGKPAWESLLKSWTEQSLPASTFEVPAGYRKEQMPGMHAPGGG
jgi:hypothetical protein